MPYPSGYVRHFPSGSLEWHNSVYSYNSNYNKLLSVADKNLLKIVKAYLSLRYKRRQKNKRIKRSLRSHFYMKKYRRSGGKYIKKLRSSVSDKIFVSLGSVKHTSSSALVNLFIYNAQKYKLIDTTLEIVDIEEKVIWTPLGKKTIYIYINRLWDFYKRFKKVYKKKKALRKINKLKYRTRLLSRKLFWKYFFSMPKVLKSLLFIYKLKLNINKLYNNNRPMSKLPLYNFYFRDFMTDPMTKLHFLKIKKNPFIIKSRAIKKNMWLHNKFNRFLKFIMLNEKKFENRSLENLRKFACKIYNKNVIFNIINLANYYLNSNIYTQIVTLKLRNRKFSLYNVLRSSMIHINIPRVAVPKSKVDVDVKKLWVNKMNIHIFDVLSEKIRNEHWLDDVLFNHRPLVNPLCLFAQEKIFNGKMLNKFIRRVFKTIKDKKLAGIRVRAKGRLTKRFKASRSVYKLRWIGGLRNIESSYQGLPAVMLRGHNISNVEYTVLSYRRRIGAYGVKGWVSSM